MLVLSRRTNEIVYLDVPANYAGGRIAVRLVEADRGKARIGFEADREIKIHRSELLDNPKDEQK